MPDLAGQGLPLDLIIEDAEAVVWKDDASLAIRAPTTIFSNRSATKLAEAISETEEFTLEAWIAPPRALPFPSGRLVTFSEDRFHVNFSLLQQANRYQLRFRTSENNENGTAPPTSTPREIRPKPTHLLYTRTASGKARFFVDGNLVVEETIEGDLSNWDPSYRLGLANETMGQRPWLGRYFLVAVYNQALTVRQVKANFFAGPGESLINRPPEVDVGNDHILRLPENSVRLQGHVDDDGKPGPLEEITVFWTQTKGPSAIAFSHPDES